MASLKRSLNRDSKINRRTRGHTVDNKSIFLLQEIKKEKSLKIKREREEKERLRQVEEES